jgi:hypothetical protein
MLLVELVSDTDVFSIPCLPAIRLVTPYQENCHPTGIECKEDAQGSSSRSQLLHIRVTRPLDRIDEWASQSRTLHLKYLDCNNDGFLLGLFEVPKSIAKLIGVLNVPRHNGKYNSCIVSCAD